MSLPSGLCIWTDPQAVTAIGRPLKKPTGENPCIQPCRHTKPLGLADRSGAYLLAGHFKIFLFLLSIILLIQQLNQCQDS